MLKKLRHFQAPGTSFDTSSEFIQLMTPVSVSASWDPERTWLYRGFLDDLDMKQTLFALLVIASATPSAMAQKEIPKAPGHEQCPLGYVNTLGTTCVSPIYYEVAPTNGKACQSGWMNIGAGYCKKKTLVIF